MKRLWLLFGLMLVLLTGCANTKQDPSASQPSAESAAEGVIEETYTGEDGTVLLTVSVVRLDVSDWLDGAAKEQVMQYYDQLYAQERLNWEEMADFAATEYDSLSSGRFRGYSVQEDYQIAGQNDAYLSIVRIRNSYMGGVHDEQSIYCEVFRRSDGVRFTLEMLFPEEADRENLVEQLAEQAEKRAAEGGYYEDAGELAAETFDPTAFYLTEEGITFVYACYSLAPYAAGPQFFTVPYAELTGFAAP